MANHKMHLFARAGMHPKGIGHGPTALKTIFRHGQTISRRVAVHGEVCGTASRLVVIPPIVVDIGVSGDLVLFLGNLKGRLFAWLFRRAIVPVRIFVGPL